MAGGETFQQFFTHLAPYAFNFAVVGGLLYKTTNKNIKKFVYQRHERFNDRFKFASEQKEAAQNKLNNIEAALKNVDSERASMIADSKSTATAEANEILQKSRQEIERMKKDSEIIMQNEQRSQKRALAQQIVDLAVARTEHTIREKLKSEDHSALIQNASGKLEAGF